jgi:outer membrane protein OmpA-like peptidoglycan-associated protein
MKFLAGAASLLALTLFVGPVVGQDAATTTAQTAVEQTAAATIPEEVLALISDSRAASELSNEELASRADLASRFAADETLTAEMRGQLQGIADASRAEIDARQQAQQPKQEEQQPAQPEQQAAPVEEKQPEQQAAPVEPPAAPAAEQAAPAAEQAVPEEVTNLLNDSRTIADIDSDELKTRAKAARRFAKNDQLPQDIRDKLNALAQDARIELTKRETQAQEQQAEPAPAPAVEPPKEQPVIVQEAPPAAETVQPVALDPPPAPPAAPAKADVQALDSNAGDPASEKQARAYLEDTTPLENFSDDDLRNRLDGIRDVMAGNELSRETERAVRKRLKEEREVLRQRLAVQEVAAAAKQAAAAPPPPPPAPLDVSAASAALPPAPPPPPPLPPLVVNNTTVSNTTVNNTVIITNVTPVPVVLRDVRPPERLQVSELQRRLQVYNEAQYDEDYDAANRDYWRASMARDREILRRRMVADRHRREAQLALEASNDDLNITINLNFSNDRPPPPRYVFAAEVDEQELEDVLVAPPRKSIKQRYSVDEIAVQPRLRETVSRIEIDTIRFGSNQAFVREEQLQSLDGIAAIIERIVKKYPNEVFMIEGHTDAPGSNIYNDKLSKLRAEAIKKALVSYYVIPARNLRTVGLGERFLKIPTAEAESENRRVSISRITNLLSAN